MKDVQNFVLCILNSYDLILDPWNVFVCVCVCVCLCVCVCKYVCTK
jgi:hypothetical protein